MSPKPGDLARLGQTLRPLEAAGTVPVGSADLGDRRARLKARVLGKAVAAKNPNSGPGWGQSTQAVLIVSGEPHTQPSPCVRHQAA